MKAMRQTIQLACRWPYLDDLSIELGLFSMKRKTLVIALAAVALGATLLLRGQSGLVSNAETQVNPAVLANQSALRERLFSKYVASLQDAASQPLPPHTLPSWMSVVLNAPAQALTKDFERLGKLPSGEAAITLGQQIEAAITADNAGGYIRALLSTEHPAVERAAISALARAADSRTMLELAGYYGAMEPERRGRILSVLEAAANPAATPGLAAIIAADTDEKRSPLMMSAMYGIANTGTVESVQYLLGLLSTENGEYAVMALERVHSALGVEMIRAAAAGNKDVTPAADNFQGALRRIADSTVRR